MSDAQWNPGYADQSLLILGRVERPDDHLQNLWVVDLAGVAVPDQDVLAIVQGEATNPPSHVLERHRASTRWGTAGVFEIVTLAVEAAVAEKLVTAGIDSLVEKYRAWRGDHEMTLTPEGAQSTARQAILLHFYPQTHAAVLRLIGEVHLNGDTFEFDFEGPDHLFNVTVEVRRHVAMVARIGCHKKL